MASMNVMDARRYVKVGQAAAIALGVSAATLWALDVPGLGKSLPPQPAARSAQAPAATGPSTPSKPIDREELAAMAGRLEIGANVKKPEIKVEAPIAETKVEQPQTEWTYLGCIQEPDRVLALVKVEDHQKILAQGRKYGDTRLVSVTPDEIVTQDGAGQHHIARAERGETRVAWVKNMPNNAPANTGIATASTMA